MVGLRRTLRPVILILAILVASCGTQGGEAADDPETADTATGVGDLADEAVAWCDAHYHFVVSANYDKDQFCAARKGEREYPAPLPPEVRELSVAGDTSGASNLWREVDAAQWASACAVAYQGLGHLSDAAHYWCTSNRRRVGSAAVKQGLLGRLPEDLAAEARKFYDSIGGVGVMITTIDLEVFHPAGYAKACEVEFESR